MTKPYVRSSKTSLKHSNLGKISKLSEIHAECVRTMRRIIDIEYSKNDHNFPNFLSKETSDIIKNETWLSARLIQSIGKQALGILKGTAEKQNRRIWQLERLNPGDVDYVNLQNKILQSKYSKPEIKDDISIMLDSRIISLEERDNSFKNWIKIASIGVDQNGQRIPAIYIPYKKTKHMKNMEDRGGKLKKSVLLNLNEIQLAYEFEKNENRDIGETIGVDIGARVCISSSNGFQSGPDNHGHDLNSIMKSISNKKKGSKAFKRKQAHRKNYINWTLNQLDLDGVSVVKCEKIKDMRRGKTSSRFLSHWTYTAIFDKLSRKCEEANVLLIQISPTYTSQRCSSCGWTKKGNRNGVVFECDSCENKMDADMNAAINISLPLKQIAYSGRLEHDIENGFYWNVLDQEPIVPDSKNHKI